MSTGSVLGAALGCTLVALVFQDSASFLQKSSHACHSAEDCGLARLTCDDDQRLVVLQASRAYHLNTTYFNQCASTVHNCSAVLSGCCVPPVPDLDCTDVYSDSSGVLRGIVRNCSGHVLSSSASGDGNNASCEVRWPLDSESLAVTAERCSAVQLYQQLSSYSTVDYACVNDSDVVQMCTPSQRTGSLLYTLWKPEQLIRNSSNANVTSCQCRVTSAATYSATFFVRAVDVRIPKSETAGDCSVLAVTRAGGIAMLNTSCSNDTEILFDTISTSVTTHVDITLALSELNPPEIIWIGFSAGSSGDNLTVTCYEAGENLPQRTPGTTVRNDSDSSSWAVAVGAAAGVIVAVILIGFVCLYCIKKRKLVSLGGGGGKQGKEKSWWERTREEDRIAELSQLGPASKVVVDTGRHMTYGGQRYRTTEDNPPIYIVPGNAVPPSSADVRRVANRSNSLGGAGVGPSVLYKPSATSDPIVIVTDRERPLLPPVKKYDISPLTITELPD